MANVFEEQAKERFRRSLAFMQKSHALLQDDLVYRSALADAVSAIKNMLQGYLLLRVATMPTSAVTQRWQEVAISNRMPDLIQACIEAGLSLHGVDRDIKRLNNERNYRTHDDPQRLVPPEQAAEAYELAVNVQKRIKAAVQGKGGAEAVGTSPAVPIRSGNSGRLAPVRAAMSGTLSTLRGAVKPDSPAPRPLPAPETPGASSVSATSTSSASTAAEKRPDLAVQAKSDTPAPAESGTTAANRDDEDDAPAPDETYVSLPVVPGPARGRRGAVVLRVVAAALLLIVGVAAGAGLMIPVARGAAPGWLGFASQLVATPTVVPTATPTATPAATAPAFYTLGALQVTTSACGSGAMTLTLANTDTRALPYAVSSSSTVTSFTSATKPAAQPAIFETLAPNATATYTVTGVRAASQLIVVTPAGARVITLPAC